MGNAGFFYFFWVRKNKKRGSSDKVMANSRSGQSMGDESGREWGCGGACVLCYRRATQRKLRVQTTVAGCKRKHNKNKKTATVPVFFYFVVFFFSLRNRLSGVFFLHFLPGYRKTVWAG